MKKNAQDTCMIEFSLQYDVSQTDPQATLGIQWEVLEQAYLSVACRAARNRTSLYQQKHAGAAMFTRGRASDLAALNRPIAEHYQLLQEQTGPLKERRVMAFPISDLTANPLRPHYHASGSRPSFHKPETNKAVYRDADARLFHLEDEPIGKVPYTLLISYERAGKVRFAIQHQVIVHPDGSLPGGIPEEIRNRGEMVGGLPAHPYRRRAQAGGVCDPRLRRSSRVWFSERLSGGGGAP